MRNKKSLFAIVGLTAVLVGGTTLAYFTQSTSVENNFATKKYGSTVTETFTPDDNWQPGATTTKIVGVTNTGEYDVLARASWKEEWTQKGATKPFEVITSETKDPNGSVVTKAIDEKWLDDVDGYYYYNELLSPEEQSGPFLKSVTLNKDTNMGTYVTTYYYTLFNEEEITLNVPMDESDDNYKNIKQLKVVETLDPSNSGYADATYKLTITIDVLQANAAAIADEWNTMSDDTKAVILPLVTEVK